MKFSNKISRIDVAKAGKKFTIMLAAIELSTLLQDTQEGPYYNHAIASYLVTVVVLHR